MLDVLDVLDVLDTLDSLDIGRDIRILGLKFLVTQLAVIVPLGICQPSSNKVGALTPLNLKGCQ